MKKHISIPKPCTENWYNMSPTERGNFCNRCSKVVMDFTSMSKKEIITYIEKQKDTVCGRLKKDQLHIAPALSDKLKRFLCSLVFVFFPFIGLAQSGINENAEVLEPIVNTISSPPKFISELDSVEVKGRINGVIENKEGEVIHNVEVRLIKEGKLLKTVYTDEHGLYKIESLEPAKYELEYSSQTYKTVILVNAQVKKDRSISLPIVLNKLGKKGTATYETRQAPYYMPEGCHTLGMISTTIYDPHPIFKSTNWFNDMHKLFNLDTGR